MLNKLIKEIISFFGKAWVQHLLGSIFIALFSAYSGHISGYLSRLFQIFPFLKNMQSFFQQNANKILTGVVLLSIYLILRAWQNSGILKFCSQYIQNTCEFLSRAELNFDFYNYEIEKLEITYIVGYLPQLDKQCIRFVIKCTSTLRMKTINIGPFPPERITAEKWKDLFHTLKPIAIDEDTKRILSVFMYRREQSKSHICLATAIKPPCMTSKKMRLRFYMLRPKLWNNLRKNGNDYGSFKLSENVPEQVVIKIILPKYFPKINIIPTTIELKKGIWGKEERTLYWILNKKELETIKGGNSISLSYELFPEEWTSFIKLRILKYIIGYPLLLVQKISSPYRIFERHAFPIKGTQLGE